MASIEPYFPTIFLAGLVTVALGLLGFVLVGFRRRVWWGLGMIAMPPAILVFLWKYPRQSLAPLILVLVGGVMTLGPPLAEMLIPIDLGPRERMVDGELHVTLTGWDRDDYRVVRSKPGLVVLQMANPDVDDRTLELLRGMDRLRELDLNDAKVTDAGLTILATLPALESLKLRGTLITDEGFKKHLAGLPKLRQIDLRGTQVSAETVNGWKAEQTGRRALR